MTTGRRLYRIVGPDGVTIDCPGLNPAHALLVFHTEALGVKHVKMRGGQFWFRSREDQKICAGSWLIVEQGVNGAASGDSITIVIPPP